MDLQSVINQVFATATSSKSSLSPFLARVFLITILSLHISTAAASPVSSLAAPAPGFRMGDALSGNPALIVPPTEDFQIASHADAVEADARPEEHGFEDLEDGDGIIVHEGHANDHRIGDAIKNAVSKDAKTPASPAEMKTSTKPSIDPLVLTTTSLPRIIEIGFWKRLLGNFLVFWALIATTIAFLVVIGIRVQRMARSGQLSRLSRDMVRRRKQWEDDGGDL